MAFMATYASHFSTLTTPQSEPARADQVQNSAGGYVFALDKWKRLERWLILGCEGGTYYASEQKLTRENAKTILECAKEDGPRTVEIIAQMSESGRAPKNDPAIFALAICAGAADPATRVAALAALPRVCRIGTHLFHFVRDVEGFRRWGRSLRRAVSEWYTSKSDENLVYDIVKYQSRDGWSHRDVLRLAHPKPKTVDQAAAFRWAVGAGFEARQVKRRDRSGGERIEKQSALAAPDLIAAYEKLKTTSDRKGACRLIAEHRMTHEMVPNDMKGDPAIWDAMLNHMPMTAMVRNLGKMSAVGLFGPFSAAAAVVCGRLADPIALKKAKIHPIALLSALRVYSQGHGEKGSLTWTPNRPIVDALDEAFYLAFDAIEPSGRRHLLALDVSGSMGGGDIAGVPGLTPREASAAMALVTMKAEPWCHIVAFTGDQRLTELNISPKMRLVDVVRGISGLPFGRTDCSLPIRYAMDQKLKADLTTIYTDNETWYGPIHPYQALKQYRQRVYAPAKLAVVGMIATSFTIADPNDAGSLDLVGFDTAAPAILSDFAKWA